MAIAHRHASELSAMIIMNADDRAHIHRLLADDPFISEGLVTELTVRQASDQMRGPIDEAIDWQR